MREVLSKTWQYVIREREEEFGLNQTYREWLHEGMPVSVLESFSEQWLQATVQKGE